MTGQEEKLLKDYLALDGADFEAWYMRRHQGPGAEAAYKATLAAAKRRERNKRASAARRVTWKVEGGCLQCGRPTTSHTRCETCHVRDNEAAAARRARFKAEGRCMQCGGPTTTYAICDAHHQQERERHLARRARLRAESQCYDCGKKVIDNFAYCWACRTRAWDRDVERRPERYKRGKRTSEAMR